MEEWILNMLIGYVPSSGCEKESMGFVFSDASLTGENYGGELRPANDTSQFDRLLDDQTDIAIYGHVHKMLRYGSKGQQILNPGTIGMPIFWLVTPAKS